jgi:hypothetical protein
MTVVEGGAVEECKCNETTGLFESLAVSCKNMVYAEIKDWREQCLFHDDRI